ncbi:hypothetical protein GCM10009557_00040 [Virgisporangium ochraceum]|uniref:Uncharacterized protein n=1 Tax=Virgisporangium ochraceum TaxID=65505 RepID=A0A8J4EGT0_9ACTN|nr:hypothetical protein [Virgisporangium ochraceum]GIJ74036.1 hypothetical protein Voc01_089530 [Virgisporangium ochraceum]
MSTTQEIQQALQQTGAGVSQALAAANAAKAKAEQAIAQSVALGGRDVIAEFTALKNAINELIASLNGSREKVIQVAARARPAGGGGG